MHEVKKSHIAGVVFLALVLMAGGLSVGCASRAGTGTAAGAGIGALVGQLAGGNTTATLIGAGLGAGVGYLIGNDMDKQAAKKIEQSHAKVETAPLGGTKWMAVEFTPAPQPPFTSYVVEFTPDGWVNTTQTFADGSVKKDQESYRIVGDTLIINDPGYIINAKYSIVNGRLHMSTDKFKVVMKQI